MRIGFVRVSMFFFGISLIGFGCLANGLQKPESNGSPSYAGFADIDPEKNHFLIVGDTQSTSLFEFWRERNDRERQLILKEIARREPAFVAHLGDLTTRGSSRKAWQEFDDVNKALREKRIPYYPIFGNHEFYGDDKKALGYYFGRFPHLEQRRWYSFAWKNVAFVMVDSNFTTLTKEENEIQIDWYLSELKRFEKDERIDHIIVCCHEPPFTNSRVVGPNKKVKVSFADPFVQFHKTCFFFSGHSHTYERFQVGGKSFIVSGGGGGPRHKVTVDPEKRRYDDLFHGPALRFFHFCEIESEGGGLAYRVLRLEDDGRIEIVDPIKIGNRNPTHPPLK
jgi:hypothetical protein